MMFLSFFAFHRELSPYPERSPSSVDERKHFGDAENERREGECIRLAAASQIAGTVREDVRQNHEDGVGGRAGGRKGASWPEWCFPRVSMSIYLPGAYSDKSVIAASERVAPMLTLPALLLTFLPTLLSVGHPLPPPSARRRTEALLSTTNTLRFLPYQRTRHYTKMCRGSVGRAKEINSHTDRRRKHRRKWE